MIPALRPVLAALLLAALPAAAQVDAQYELASGDRVRVTVYGHEDLSGEFELDASGRIAMPLIQYVDAAGLTLEELERAINAKLQPDYLKNPRVSAEIVGYRPFYILGEVNAPGSYPYVNGITVINAVAVAGGFTYRARKGRIRIERTVGGESLEIDADSDTPVLPGDVITVPERFF